MVSFKLTLLSSMLIIGTSFALPTAEQRKSNYKLNLVHQFPNFTWLENMAIRSNGQIMATNLENGTVLLVDLRVPPNSTPPPVIASFGQTTALTGIVEVEDDVFYVQGVNNTNALEFQYPPNSTTVWRIDMRPYARKGYAEVRKLADLPELIIPNGMALLSKSAGTILISDSVLGQIWRLCVRSGHPEMVIDDPLLKPIQGSSTEVGANGLKVIGSTLYFASTNQGIIGTFPISWDGKATGPATRIIRGVTDADDFAVGPDGSIWVAENVANTLVRILPTGNIITVAGGANSTDLAGPVSARFGRTLKDRHILYVSTDGLSFDSDSNLLTTNGKIVSVDTSRY